MLWNRIKRLLRASEASAAKNEPDAEGHKHPRSNLQPRSHMLALEPRLMFDAAALVTAVDGAQDAADSTQTSDSQTETQQDDQSEILDLCQEHPRSERFSREQRPPAGSSHGICQDPGVTDSLVV